MFRFVLLVLMIVLPTQLIWAAAAPYCGHEGPGVVAENHFGHHEHRHQTAGQPGADDSGHAQPSKSSSAPHLDCESCHLGSALTTLAASMVVVAVATTVSLEGLPIRFTSHIPVAPERPDICKLDAAARSANGVGPDHRIQIFA